MSLNSQEADEAVGGPISRSASTNDMWFDDEERAAALRDVLAAQDADPVDVCVSIQRTSRRSASGRSQDRVGRPGQRRERADRKTCRVDSASGTVRTQ
jgi:hypothetical protein